MKKYGKESRHNVISRKDNLILVPDKPSTLQEEGQELTNGHIELNEVNGDAGEEVAENGLASSPQDEVDESSDKTEFELHDVFAYIKTGIGSIIEDEVTQRFVAEELKVRFHF